MYSNINTTLKRNKEGFSAYVEFPPEQVEAWKAEEAQKKLKALEYLKTKFPDVDEKVFRIDYSGYLHEEIIDWPAVYKATIIGDACAECNNSRCEIPESLGIENSRPVISISENSRGGKFLDVRWTCRMKCKFDPLIAFDDKFIDMFKKSGIFKSGLNQTFESYIPLDLFSDTECAKAEAIKASRNQSCLMIAGGCGTGKTHLAVAIAIEAMKNGQQAIFRTAADMILELKQAEKDVDEGYLDYFDLVELFSNVPCLIIDDLRDWYFTDAELKFDLKFISPIVANRCEKKLQTIITTSAVKFEDLQSWKNDRFIAPIVACVNKLGKFVTIEHAPDYRIYKKQKFK